MKAWRCYETRSPKGDLEMIMKLSPWRIDFRGRIAVEGQSEVVFANDRQLTYLAERELKRKGGRPLGAEASLVERIQEALRSLQEGPERRGPASPDDQKMGRKKESRAPARVNDDKPTGLEPLDCAFEQIILDFPSEHDNDPQSIAKANLARIETSRQALER